MLMICYVVVPRALDVKLSKNLASDFQLPINDPNSFDADIFIL